MNISMCISVNRETDKNIPHLYEYKGGWGYRPKYCMKNSKDKSLNSFSLGEVAHYMLAACKFYYMYIFGALSANIYIRGVFTKKPYS